MDTIVCVTHMENVQLGKVSNIIKMDMKLHFSKLQFGNHLCCAYIIQSEVSEQDSCLAALYEECQQGERHMRNWST